jgi:hypothetical protein
VRLEGRVQRDAVHRHQVGVAHAAANDSFLHAQTAATGQLLSVRCCDTHSSYYRLCIAIKSDGLTHVAADGCFLHVTRVAH